MTNPSQQLGPVGSKERIRSLDVLRGVALLGILLMNIAGFGLVFMHMSIQPFREGQKEITS